MLLLYRDWSESLVDFNQKMSDWEFCGNAIFSIENIKIPGVSIYYRQTG
jgi:hypothetical protein